MTQDADLPVVLGETLRAFILEFGSGDKNPHLHTLADEWMETMRAENHELALSVVILAKSSGNEKMFRFAAAYTYMCLRAQKAADDAKV